MHCVARRMKGTQCLLLKQFWIQRENSWRRTAHDNAALSGKLAFFGCMRNWRKTEVLFIPWVGDILDAYLCSFCIWYIRNLSEVLPLSSVQIDIF